MVCTSNGLCNDRIEVKIYLFIFCIDINWYLIKFKKEVGINYIYKK